MIIFVCFKKLEAIIGGIFVIIRSTAHALVWCDVGDFFIGVRHVCIPLALMLHAPENLELEEVLCAAADDTAKE